MPIINPEFQKLIPALSEEEYNQLEKNIVADGCRDPIVLWGDTVIDGHNRLSICRKNCIPYKAIGVEFDNDNDVKEWMILNQFGKRNISNYQRAELALLLKPLLAEKAKENQKIGAEKTNTGLQKSVKAINTQKEIADQAGVSHDTISKVERIQKDATPEVIEQVKSGDISINKAYQDIKKVDKKIERVEKINEISAGNEDLDISKTYPVIYADPPWQYNHTESANRAIENHYPTMTLDDICNMPVSDLATKDAILFLWTTSPKLEEGIRVLNSWGFEYTTCAIWDKQKKGLGYYFRQNHELLLIGKRGSIPTPDPKDRPDSIISEPRGDHSEKPARFYEIIEAMYPDFEKIELFCRNPRNGWSVWGNQSENT